MQRYDAIISREDEDVSDAIREILEGEGIQFRMKATCLSGISNKRGAVTVKVDCEVGSPEITGSHLLLAVGRVPNTDTLNLGVAGIDAEMILKLLRRTCSRVETGK